MLVLSFACFFIVYSHGIIGKLHNVPHGGIVILQRFVVALPPEILTCLWPVLCKQSLFLSPAFTDTQCRHDNPLLTDDISPPVTTLFKKKYIYGR